MKEPRILDLDEITVVGGRHGLPAPTVDGKPACPVCLERPREVKWRKGGYLEGGEVYKRRCYECRRKLRRYSGPDVFGSRDFPCEGHRWTRCSLCPRDPEWKVAADRLSVLSLYRLGVQERVDSGSVGLPCGPFAATFFKREAVEVFGAEAVSVAWRQGLSAFEADEWATRLADRHPRTVWPGWEALADAEAAAGRALEGSRRRRRRRP